MRLLAAAAALAIVLVPASASATITVVKSSSDGLTLGGYVRTFEGLQVLRFDTPSNTESQEDRTALNTGIGRMEWTGKLGANAGYDVDDLLFWRVQSRPTLLEGGGLGVGVSRPAERTVVLRWKILDEPNALLVNDIDRLDLRIHSGPADVTLGRQAITWGNSLIFPVTDLWTTFSPFELDQQQKPGIDAARVIAQVSKNSELDVAIADRGETRDFSAGAKTTFYLKHEDVYGAVVKHWRELFAMGGVSAEAGSFKLRAEGALPWELDDQAILRPRATMGVDWITEKLQITIEGNYNGVGAAETSGYLAQAASPAFARGESYLLGRWYAGTAANWKPSELFTISAGAIANVQDPSAMITGSVDWRVTENTDLIGGFFRGVGEEPTLALPAATLYSEFGSYGDLYWLQLAVFY